MADAIPPEEQPEFEEMDADDWREYLREHDDRRLLISALDGLHSVEYDSCGDDVAFYAHGNAGFNGDGTQAVLEDLAGSSKGLEVVKKDDGGEA